MPKPCSLACVLSFGALECMLWLWHAGLDSPLLLLLQYEPELFPGLIYRMKQPKVVLLIFVSGNVVLTGKFPPSPPPASRV